MKFASVLLISLVLAGTAQACNIPVFRYALERWRPDECEVIVFHQEPLTRQQEMLLARAVPTKSVRKVPGEESTVQVPIASVIKVDINAANDNKEADPRRDLWLQFQGEAGKSLPYVVVRAKVGNGRAVNAWHGPLQSVATWDVFESPAREETARRLLAGHAVVWLVLASDDRQRNTDLRERLAENLTSLSGKIQLPDGIGLPGSELYSEIPLLTKFSLLEISHDDPREKFLIDWFSSFRPGTLEEGEPLVVPVFGRGRALEVIPADDLSARLVEDLTAFLSGACSCQVKEQNPGFDLLFSVDWNKELFGEGWEPPPAKTVGDRGRPKLLTIPPGR